MLNHVMICGCLCQPAIPSMVPSIHLLRQLFMLFGIPLFACVLLASLFPYPRAQVGGRIDLQRKGLICKRRYFTNSVEWHRNLEKLLAFKTWQEK